MKYDFANNKVKLNQAIATVGEKASYEDVKKEYVRRGGLLINQVVEEVISDTTPSPFVETPKGLTIKKKTAKKKAVKK